MHHISDKRAVGSRYPGRSQYLLRTPFHTSSRKLSGIGTSCQTTLRPTSSMCSSAKLDATA